MNPNKPLNGKSYGSIPHFSFSRFGSRDYHCHEGQEKICLEKTRDKNDLIIVQEKLDGSNVGIAKINNQILAITRAGYLATTSPYRQHHIFSDWVEKNKLRFDSLLCEGERVCGEWLAQAHGTRYKLPHEPFVVFDIMQDKKRLNYLEFSKRIGTNFVLPHLYYFGENPFPKTSIFDAIEHSGHGAIDPVEGVIYRVERNEKVDFLVKFVRQEKEDGKYLPEITGSEEIWNWQS